MILQQFMAETTNSQTEKFRNSRQKIKFKKNKTQYTLLQQGRLDAIKLDFIKWIGLHY